jgi:hypothetical protein
MNTKASCQRDVTAARPTPLGLERPSEYVKTNVVAPYRLALPPCPCPRTSGLRGISTLAPGNGSHDCNPYPSSRGLVSPSKLGPTPVAACHALADVVLRHLSWGSLPFDAWRSGRPVSLEVPPPSSRHVRFLTASRLALRPDPFRSCFVPMASMGFSPSEPFPSEEPCASRRPYPPDVSVPLSGPDERARRGDRSPPGCCSPRKSDTFCVLVGHDEGRCSPGVLPLQGVPPRGRSAALNGCSPHGLDRHRGPKAAITNAPQGVSTTGLACLSRGCRPSWGFPPCRRYRTSLRKDTP